MENTPIHPPSSILHPRRILVRSTNWLGDAVMTAPALLRLREKFPDAKIAILTPKKLHELWLNHPAIDEVISFSPDETIFAVAKKLSAGKFDLALVFPNSPRSAIEVFLARIPQRIGCSRPWRNFFLTQTIPPRADAVKMRKLSLAEIKNRIATEAQRAQSKKINELCVLCDSVAKSKDLRHQIHEYLHLVSALGANSELLPPKLFVTSEEIEAARKKFGLDKIENPIFGLNPGAEYGAAKRWPVEKFIVAAKKIQQRTNCVWILFGGKNDLAIANQIESAIRNPQSAIFNFAGKTSLRELMALLKSCRVLLTNDTGPMHVAAALDVPIVTIFGSTSPELTGPIFSDKSKILKSDAPCSPCFLRECPIDFRCMNGIAVEKVVEAVLKSI
ncbi:MAG TPA: lipopolysaccharide heptosyltransferase II [Verrucomicrobiae bacterium]|nr:lipopolysaccharide heptosyltransferase II [Verrucomicrobiae bacterium]